MVSAFFIILLLILALVFFIKRHVTVRGEKPYGGEAPLHRVPIWPLGILFLLIAVIWAFFACTTIVQAKEIGVLTTFGKPADRTLGSGLNTKLPWQSVTTIDGTIQTDKYKDENCIPVRIGDGSNSCLSITHRWQVVPENANDVYANYRSNDPTQSLRDAVVETQLVSVAQDILSKYNPIASLKVVEGADANADLNFAPDYTATAEQISAEMDQRYGENPLVKTVAITVSGLTLSKTTQDKINAFIAEVANTRIAVQKEQTAAAEARANKALQENISDLTLQSKCLDLIAEGQKIGYQFPAGFSCWQGSGSSIVVPATK